MSGFKATDIDQKLAELAKKLEVELKLKSGAAAMLSKLIDPNARAQCQASNEDADKRIQFLREEMAKLQHRKDGSSAQARHGATAAGVQPPPSAVQAMIKHWPSKVTQSCSPSSSASSSTASASPVPHHTSPEHSSTRHNEKTGFFKNFITGSRNSTSSALSSNSDLYGSSILHQGLTEDPSLLTVDQVQRSKQKRSNLLFSRSNMPLSRRKIATKLQDLTYKKEVEQKIKKASDRLISLYQQGSAGAGVGSGGNVNDSSEWRPSNYHNLLKIAQCDQVESALRLSAIKTSLQRYQGLFFGDEDDSDEAGEENGLQDGSQELSNPSPVVDESVTPTAYAVPSRKKILVSGTLKISVLGLRVPPSVRTAMSLANSDSYGVIVRVDGKSPHSYAGSQDNACAGKRIRLGRIPKSKHKTGRHVLLNLNEEISMKIEKAQEIEVAVVEQSKSGEVLSVIGLFWFTLFSLLDELDHVQRQLELGSAAARNSSSRRGSEKLNHHHYNNNNNNTNSDETPVLEGWFDMDPCAHIRLKLQFNRTCTATKRANAIGQLGRQNALRKQQAKNVNGHKFNPQQFYQIMRCAYCGEFIGLTGGYQCEECKYTCHKKCFSRVVTKCIAAAKGDDETDDSRMLAKSHHIPHRFQPSANYGANWCCHCGSLLPIGRGHDVIKCSECDTMAHRDCGHHVPSFCGMSVQMANKMLAEVKAAAKAKEEAKRQRHRMSQVDVAPEQALPSKEPHTMLHKKTKGLPHLDVTLPLELAPPTTISDLLASPQDLPFPSERFAKSTAPTPSPKTTLPQVHHHLQHKPPTPPRATLDDFQFLAVLGKGNFGKVMLAEEKSNRRLFAIKVLKKDYIIENDEVDSTKSEKRIFQCANRARHPFLIGLHSCFQTETRIYFVMEYVSGGDLMLHIQREQFSEKRARFYAIEVMLALEFFHKQGIVYRDLKLDNIMLSLDGHIKIADYGLCKENMGYGHTTNTFCGTPEFMAPEILLEQPYTRAVDWWAFGVLIYEMILGQSPFRGDDEEEIYDSILGDEVAYSSSMSREAVSVCQQLLIKDPRKRLGGSRNDSEDIKRHSFFRGIKFDDYLHKRVQPPFLPSINHATDVSNFDEEFTRKMPVLTPVNSALDEVDQNQFKGFSYAAPFVFEQAPTS